jgi:hypothetical protein
MSKSQSIPIGRRIRFKHIQKELDLDLFEKLTDILYEAFKGNKSACARALGISTPTWIKWETHPPHWPYWNYVMRKVIVDVCSDITNRTSSATRKHRVAVITSLSKLPKDDPIREDVEYMGYDQSAAYVHLRQLLIKKGMFTDEIFTAANMGGFSKKTLIRQSYRLGVVKTLQGYGSAKRSYWRLPNEDDD